MATIIHHLKPRPDRSIPFIIFLTFLGTFLVSRLFVYLFPEFFIPIHGEHVHHFAYGIVLLSIVGFVTTAYPLSPRSRLTMSVFYGIALGLAFDEFAMWLNMDEVLYHARLTYDAILIIALFFLNLIYFANFWKKWGTRLGTLLKYIFVSGPRRLFHLLIS